MTITKTGHDFRSVMREVEEAPGTAVAKYLGQDEAEPTEG